MKRERVGEVGGILEKVVNSYKLEEMDNSLLYNKLAHLPEQMKVEVSDFIDFLLSKAKKNKTDNPIEAPRAQFGSGKGTFVKMSDDFDAPLDDFKDYMN